MEEKVFTEILSVFELSSLFGSTYKEKNMFKVFERENQPGLKNYFTTSPSKMAVQTALKFWNI